MTMSARRVRRERARKLSSEVLDFKAELVRQRKHMELSQAEVAERMGITQSSVSAMERYDSNPTLKTVLKYASAVEALLELNVIDDCCADSNEMFAQMSVTGLKWHAPAVPTDSLTFYRSSRDEFELAT